MNHRLSDFDVERYTLESPYYPNPVQLGNACIDVIQTKTTLFSTFKNQTKIMFYSSFLYYPQKPMLVSFGTEGESKHNQPICSLG